MVFKGIVCNVDVVLANYDIENVFGSCTWRNSSPSKQLLGNCSNSEILSNNAIALGVMCTGLAPQIVVIRLKSIYVFKKVICFS